MIRCVCLWILGSSAEGLADTDVTGRDGQKDTGGEEKEAETENDTPKQTTGKTSAQTGFTVLGGFENKPVQKVQWFANGANGSGVISTTSINPVFFCSQVHRVLPQWLAQPDVIHRDIKSNLVPISDIPGLSAQLVNKLQNNGIQHFFPGNDRL